MLKIALKPHRASLRAGVTDPQKLFVMLKLLPEAEVAQARPPFAVALVIDTSGSMSGDKLNQAMQAAHTLIDDDRLAGSDQVTVIHFDDSAAPLIRLCPASQKGDLHRAVDELGRHSGGTHMARGMECALQELSRVPAQTAKRVVLLTDGETFDEPECPLVAQRFADANTPIVAVGVGDEYNENLLLEIANSSAGRPYHLKGIADFRQVLEDELGTGVKEVVTDLQASVSLVKGVQVDGFTKVFPSLTEVAIADPPYRLGNIPAGDYTYFIVEMTVSGIPRPPSRARLARLGLAGHVPGLGRRDELPPEDLFVEFTNDEAAIAAVDAEVLAYVQQKNVDRMVQEAVRQSTSDPTRARQTLQAAAGMTQRLGNAAATQMLTGALDELNKTGTISAGTRKTVALGGKTKTVKAGGSDGLGDVPSEDEIRRLTGT